MVAIVITVGGESNTFPIMIGLYQGSVLISLSSPLVINDFTRHIPNEVTVLCYLQIN